MGVRISLGPRGYSLVGKALAWHARDPEFKSPYLHHLWMWYHRTMPLSGDAKREYQRKWLAKRRQDWIDSQGGVCAVCGSDDRLEVDHIDPSTKTCNPRDIWSRAQAFRDAELAKCQVLCYTHHLEKTNAEKFVPHGTNGRYNDGCRCAPCTAAHSALAREWRAAGKKW